MISGKTIGLRAIEREDLILLRDWRNNPDFRRNFREYRELNLHAQEQWFEKTVKGSANDFMFCIVRLSDGKPVGVGGLTYINWIIRSADVSLYIGEQNIYIDEKGMADEAAQLLISYAFEHLNLNKLWTELYEFDERKIKLFTERLGFSKDGTLRDNCFKEGRFWNSFLFSRLQSDKVLS